MAAQHIEAEDRPEFAGEFAAFSSRLQAADLDPAVLEAVRVNLFDTLACAVAGISARGVDQMIEMVRDWGGRPEASVWCSDLRVPAPMAALVNGMMAHARDFDDTHDGAVLHAGVSVIPAALAAAEAAPAATGADLLAGIAAGLELISRLGVATRVGIIESGYMYTSLFGHFAATAAAARVWRLSEAETVNALGVAYSQAAGTHQVTRDAALTKRVQPGFAAKTAQISVAMTRRGIRGAQRSFEGVDGLFRSYLHDRYDPARLRAGLGRDYELLNLSYKPYPCCRFNHPAIDAALEVRAALTAGARIGAIRAFVNRQAYEAVATPPEIRRRPETIVQAQFSIPYTVAVALLRGEVGLTDFTDPALLDAAVQALAARVEVFVDPEIERDWGRSISPVRLEVETDQGVVVARVDHPRGSLAQPMTAADFDAKLAGCARTGAMNWPADLAAGLRHDILGLSGQGTGRDVVRRLRPDPA